MDDTVVSSEMGVLPGDKALATDCLAVLMKEYPGWKWTIDIPPSDSQLSQDALIVRNLSVDPEGKYGFLIRKSTMDAACDKAKFAGGEFLERFNIRRTSLEAARKLGFDDRTQIFERPEV